MNLGMQLTQPHTTNCGLFFANHKTVYEWRHRLSQLHTQLNEMKKELNFRTTDIKMPRQWIPAVKRMINQMFNVLGYKIIKDTERQSNGAAFKPISSCSKIYMGCGEDVKDGYIGCDIRALPSVQIVCNAWSLSAHVKDAREIYTRHMLEHLTLSEVDAALNDWFKALAVGGSVHIVVPNLDVHIEQWKRAEWTPESFKERWSDARYGFAGLYGWQRECDPRDSKYNNSYWDVHKSGYDQKNLRFLLEYAGFANISITFEDDVHLVAKATKVAEKEERQISPFLSEIRADHRGRYEYAKSYLKTGDILDIACGIGYGSKMVASAFPQAKVTGVDISEGAVAYAREYYTADNLDYRVGDAQMPLGDLKYDAAISFETIEHLLDAKAFLKSLHAAIRVGGKLIASTPNQDVMPFSSVQFPYHVRHFTHRELKSILEDCGFRVLRMDSQHDQNNSVWKEDVNGKYLLVVAEKN